MGWIRGRLRRPVGGGGTVDNSKLALFKSFFLYIFCSLVAETAISYGAESDYHVRYGKGPYETRQFYKSATTEHIEFAEFTLESLTVFAFARPDLLKYHLDSIDLEVEQVFVVMNRFSREVTLQMRNILKLFDCRDSESTHHIGEYDRFKCMNPFIKKLVLLESDENNVGFAGSFNLIAKHMLQNDIHFTIISNDDTRFLPGSLKKIAKLFYAKPHICLYLFSHFSSFGITQTTLRKIGSMDEHFWPAYSEDIDYHLRSIIGGCTIFKASQQKGQLFVSHGESPEWPGTSATLRANESYRNLIENTKHSKFGRDAYLCKKWGGGCEENGRDFLNSNKVFKAIFQRESNEHEMLDFADYSTFDGTVFLFPFNQTNLHISWWDNDDKAQISIISPRSINKQHAPLEFVWKLEDQKQYFKL